MIMLTTVCKSQIHACIPMCVCMHIN